MHVRCAQCNRPLSRDCRLGLLSEYRRSASDRESPVPRGVVIRLTDAFSVRLGTTIVGVTVRSAEGALAVNPEDVVPDALLSAGIDNGCCGSDGMDGPNRRCICGAIVATETNDCWTYAEVRFEPGTTVLL